MKTILILIIIILCIVIFVLFKTAADRKRDANKRFDEYVAEAEKFQESVSKELYEKRMVLLHLYALLVPGKTFRIKRVDSNLVISELFKKDSDASICLKNITVKWNPSEAVPSVNQSKTES